MERNSPLLQAVKSALEPGVNKDDDEMVNMMSSEVRSAVISYDQMSYLLTIMITVSIISILILLFSVTVIIGFLWYTRRLLNSKCGCSNLQSANNNIPYQQQLIAHPGYQNFRGQLTMSSPGPGQHQPRHENIYSQKNIYRPNKNVTVNPLSRPHNNQFGSRRNLVPSINPSLAVERSLDNSISSTDYDINQKNQTLREPPSDPIYAEIKVKESKDPDNNVQEQTQQSNSSKTATKQNKTDQHREPNGKKEIEYWQITAKEVVKFRPCTETFILRE